MYQDLVENIGVLLERIEKYEPLITEGLMTEAEAAAAAEITASLEEIDRQADNLLEGLLSYADMLKSIEGEYGKIARKSTNPFAGKYDTIRTSLEAMITKFDGAQSAVKGYAQQNFGNVFSDDAIGGRQSVAGLAWRGINSFFGGDSKKKESLQRLAAVAAEFSKIHLMAQSTIRGMARGVKYAEKEQKLDDNELPIIGQISPKMLSSLEKSISSEVKGKGSGFFGKLASKFNIFSQDVDDLLGLKESQVMYAFFGMTPAMLLAIGKAITSMGNDINNIAASMKSFGKAQAKAELEAKKAKKASDAVYAKYSAPIDAADIVTPKDDKEAISTVFADRTVQNSIKKVTMKKGKAKGSNPEASGLLDAYDPMLKESVHNFSMNDLMFEHDELIREERDGMEEMILEYLSLLDEGTILEREDIKEISQLILEAKPRRKRRRKGSTPKKSTPKKSTPKKSTPKSTPKKDTKGDDKKASKAKYKKVRSQAKKDFGIQVKKVDDEKSTPKQAKTKIGNIEKNALRNKDVKKYADRKRNIQKDADSFERKVDKENKENKAGGDEEENKGGGTEEKKQYQRVKKNTQKDVNIQVDKVDKEKSTPEQAHKKVDNIEKSALKTKAIKKNKDRTRNIKAIADKADAAIDREDKENETGEEVENELPEVPEDGGGDDAATEDGADGSDDGGTGGGVSDDGEAEEQTEEEAEEAAAKEEELAATENEANLETYSSTVDILMDKFVETEVAGSADTAEEMAQNAVKQLPESKSLFDRWARIAGLEKLK